MARLLIWKTEQKIKYMRMQTLALFFYIKKVPNQQIQISYQNTAYKTLKNNTTTSLTLID